MAMGMENQEEGQGRRNSPALIIDIGTSTEKFAERMEILSWALFVKPMATISPKVIEAT
jgi:hypothetical protein